MAGEILDAAADADLGDRRARLRAKAAAAGILRATDGVSVDEDERREVIESTKGLGPVVDRLIAAERERV